jgi:hypothetical protein
LLDHAAVRRPHGWIAAHHSMPMPTSINAAMSLCWCHATNGRRAVQ